MQSTLPSSRYRHKKKKTTFRLSSLVRCVWLLPVALVLFLLCDTVIGLQVASMGYLPIGEGSWLYRVIFPGWNMAWAFYLPSQVMLAVYASR